MDRDKPEYKTKRTKNDLVKYLEIRGWLTQRMSADAFLKGFPDLFCADNKWGTRWVEVRRPENHTLNKAQRRRWALWDELRIGIWVLTAATQEEFNKLYKPPNWVISVRHRSARLPWR